MTNLDVIQETAEYYGKEMTPSMIKVYLGTLDDLPPELLDMAAKQIIKTGKPFMPKVSEIRVAAAEIKRLGLFEEVDPLKMIPGAAQTEADLDERYGTIEEHREICEVFASSGTLSGRQQEILRLG